MRQCGRALVEGVALVVALGFTVRGIAEAAPPEAPSRITAKAAVVMDGSTGEILWAREADRPLPPASTTKIMTTTLALERGRLDRHFEVSKLAAAQVPSKLGLRAGQTVELDDLTYALMLKSANDASVVVAEGLGGSVAGFAEMMNERARQLGATQTTFRNPHGLPHSEHVSSAQDMALMLRHALTVPGFREVAGTSAKVIQIEDKKIHPMTVRSKNRLLSGYFVRVLGKTGYTRAAGRCFAGAAELNGRQIITVVFNAPDMWGDTRRLMQFAFASFEDTAPVVQLAQQKGGASRSVAKASSKKRKVPTKVATKKRKSSSAEVASKSRSDGAKKPTVRKSSAPKRTKTSVQTARRPAKTTGVQNTSSREARDAAALAASVRHARLAQERGAQR